MITLSIPGKIQQSLLDEALSRDLATARKTVLLEILWHERYLTREQLIARVERVLGRYCFGRSAWKDTFYRDMRFVKDALEKAGYRLRYSRDSVKPGYYLQGQPALSPETAEMIQSSRVEIDPNQINIYRRLPVAERFRLGCSVSDTARRVVAYRIQQRNPNLSLAEANLLAVQGQKQIESGNP